LELGLKIKTINLKGDSFSVDVKEDYIKATKFILSDKYLKMYKV
jgi:3-deoxy-manno-octulosonate cytidylyltransferase (CMP-KDO synthetase)